MNSLIPSIIKGDESAEDQKEEWNSFWGKIWMQKIMNKARNLEADLMIRKKLKPYLNRDTFCEIGCGSGVLLSKVSKYYKNIIGIDYSPDSLMRAKEYLSSKNIDNFTLSIDDIRDSKLADKFDVTYSNGLVEHFDDPGKIILNHLNLTKKGGVCIIIVPYAYSIKNAWYKATRLKIFNKFWPWTSQIFFTKKTFLGCFKEYAEMNKYEIRINVCRFTENLIADIRVKQ